MKNFNLKTSLYLIAGLSILIFLGLATLQGINNFDFLNISKLISQVVTADFIIITMF
jgi:low affinity Fe/Cu permease